MNFTQLRNAPVCNRIVWFLMKAETLDYKINEDDKKIKKAATITLSKHLIKSLTAKDKSLLNIAYRKLKGAVIAS